MWSDIKHLPGIILIISLISSVILCSIKNRRVAKILYILLAFFALTASFLILIFLKKDFIYSFGGWKNGIGIDIAINHTSAFFLAMTATIFFITSFSITSCEKIKTNLFGFCGLVFTGLCGLILTVDWFNFYVFLEVTSICLYVLLTADDGSRKSYSSAFNYLIIGSIANIFILLGIFFIYFTTGTLNMAITAKIISQNQISADSYILVQAAYILIISGLIAKSALYPLHSWIMNCYIKVPSALTAFISAIITKIFIFNIYKINNIFGYVFISLELKYFIGIVVVLCYLAIVICSIGALLDKNLKTILAFSSMSQSGYFLLGIFCFNHSVNTGVLLQMLVHSLSIATLFMIIEIVEKRFNYKININLSILKQSLHGQSLLKFSFLIALFSIVGFPITLGFIAKWYILSGFYLSLKYLSFAITIIGGAIGMLYSWRIVEYLFFYGNSQIIKSLENNTKKIAFFDKMLIFALGLSIILLGIFNEKIFKIIILAT